MTSDNPKHLFRELFHVRGSFERNKIFAYWQGLKAGNEASADNIWPHELSMKVFFPWETRRHKKPVVRIQTRN